MPRQLMPSTRRLLASAVLGLAMMQPVSAQVEQPATGLDALDDAATLGKITELGLESLLRHTLERQGVPEDQADLYLADIALSRLTGERMIPADERQPLVLDIVAGVDEQIAVEPGDRERAAVAGQMIRRASVLIDRGIGEEVRLLEYFGDNPERRRYVGTVATAVGKLLERSAELYIAEQLALEDKIVSAEQREVQLATQAQQAARQARSLIPFADYYRVLGTVPDTPDRINLAEDVADQLKPLDVPRNPNRAFVELMLGKIYLARGGKEGREQARDYYDRAIAGTTSPVRLFDAYFGRTVVEALDGNADAAQEQLSAFNSWFDAQSPETVPGRRPLLLVAGYRVAEANAANATSSEAREAAKAESTRFLMSLVDQFEGYRPVVTGQLLARIDADTDLSGLSP
ncbi:MAG: hypothetical protein AAF561_06900, partial [Planctomycetota bacterium]